MNSSALASNTDSMKCYIAPSFQ